MSSTYFTFFPKMPEMLHNFVSATADDDGCDPLKNSPMRTEKIGVGALAILVWLIRQRDESLSARMVEVQVRLCSCHPLHLPIRRRIGPVF